MSSNLASFSHQAKLDSAKLSNTVPMNDATFEIWSKLEKLELEFVDKYKKFHIISGVIYSKAYIGNQVGIPAAFYKIYFSPLRDKMIGFLVPHKTSFKTKNVYLYQVTVDSLEKVIGFDLFTRLDNQREAKLEKTIAHF